MFLQHVPVSKILYCSKIYTKPDIIDVSGGRHAHALVFFIEGNCDYVYGDKVYSASAGSVLFLPYGREYVIHRFSMAQCIYVDFLTCGDADAEPFVKNYPNSSQFRDVFGVLLSLYRQKKIGYEAEMMSALYKLISMIQTADRTAYFPGVKYQKIADAVEHINKNYCSGNLRISSLAKLSGVSTRYFAELFSVFFGVSPKEYILRMQLETAKNLLISTDDSISSIAEVCGFSDVYYFSKIFKKELGETPSMFRKVNKAL
ncbi:MAG: helix-turn-helix transcriptional regulator [Clostridia bacterium]|nr:helix-turn-helix transcriptional regulator [Clostridia bacterium]